jgi:pyridoxine kinase
MGDDGELYSTYTQDLMQGMRSLVRKAHIIAPNLTEACFLTGCTYQESYDKDYIMDIISKLHAMGIKWVVLTGIAFQSDMTGVLISGEGTLDHYVHSKISRNFHGTGDVYASAFVGSWISGKTMNEVARIAADYTCKCIENTIDDESHWYGVKFETALPYLIGRLTE